MRAKHTRSASSVLAAVVLVLGWLNASPATQQKANPNRWERDIAAYEAADKTNAPPKGAAVFVGSSSIRMWKTLTEDFAGIVVIGRGFGGSQLSDSVRYAD